jgi:hypothetical protein
MTPVCLPRFSGYTANRRPVIFEKKTNTAAKSDCIRRFGFAGVEVAPGGDGRLGGPFCGAP